ncbi:MAG TPA: hypothetical protein DEQ80_05375 [Anaerolinea thermolimosa]|uniref:Glycosyltransferase RgtA/B/C/D-like domain-containing protein n=1 Tax=Anaerolinea thermolimosa TaxID=229919 RepID=A0A3D1JFA5_9CHLR|nr:hypothetical protein [Anaerolinea thermolimosa]
MNNQPSRFPFFAVLVFELVFLMAVRTPVDSDLFWHLAVGEQTLQTGHPMLSDTFSYTREGAAWINHSWLGEVVLAWAYRVGGWVGLSFLVACLAGFSLLIVYWMMSGPPLWRAFLIVLIATVSAPVWSPRPQLFTLVCLAILWSLIRKFRGGAGKALFFLPFLFVIWSNLHGGYSLGFILLGCQILGMGLDRVLRRQDAPSLRSIGQWGMWSVVSGLAVLINPNGLNTWRIPFQTVGVQVLQQAIPEWASPDFHVSFQQPFLLMLAGLLLAFGLSGRKVEGGGLAATVVFSTLALMARRNVGPFAIVTGPLLAEYGWQVLERLKAGGNSLLNRLVNLGSTGETTKPRLLLDASILGLLALACLVKGFAVSQPEQMSRALQASYPVKAVAWIRENQPPGRLFNEYAWGGYIIYALPEYPVFVDGRTDLYGDEIIGEWLRIMNQEEGWMDLINRYHIRLMLIPADSRLPSRLKTQGWRLAYQDDVASVLIRQEQGFR